MIQIDNPWALFVVFVFCVAGLVIYPFMMTERFRFTSAKIVAIVIAVGISIYSGTFAFVLVLLWPLSFIGFPEYWGNYTGFIHGPFIDKKSPPIVVSMMGWFFLVVFPLLLMLITSR
ncbi:hypothetical protein Pla52o_45090 [Novipirellula galeiformis]|uniref:Uncharacterized protein n=1 Tax=Novipirellula galeiformis TaxID=2528004 RepID=A0A5C6CB31_9BACT|nr:hypothetical protein [Novipirellula galeiformis]TWU20631.1 hypothetical protein Pla52o_45090 [Novipirellula galeiformis]